MFLNPCLFSFELHYAFFRVIRFLTNNPVDYGFLAVVFFIFLFTIHLPVEKRLIEISLKLSIFVHASYCSLIFFYSSAPLVNFNR